MTMWRTDHYENASDIPYDHDKAKAERKRRGEAKERLDAAVGPLVPEKKEPLEDTRPFLDMVRNYGEGVSLAQRDRWRTEDYRRRRAEFMQSTSSGKPTEAEIRAARDTVDRIHAYNEREARGEYFDIDALEDD